MGPGNLYPGKKCACGTVCLSASEASYVSGVVSTKLFGMCRSQEFNIEGFPNFDGTLADLKHFQKSPVPDYKVTVACGNDLVIQEALVQFWSNKHPEFTEKMNDLLSNHNFEFNPKQLKRGAEEIGNAGETEERPSKRLCLNTAKTIEELEKDHPDRFLDIVRNILRLLSLTVFS